MATGAIAKSMWLPRVTSKFLQNTVKCSYSLCIQNSNLLDKNSNSLDHNLVKNLHVSSQNYCDDREFIRRFYKSRKTYLKSSINDDGTDGSSDLTINYTAHKFGDIFPDETTPDLMFGGTKFSMLPIVDIKVSKNNTIMSLNRNGKAAMLNSCGMEGFRCAKKGTNVAAQATAITLGIRMLKQGVKHVRVQIKGFGPGRLAAVKGLSMAGVNVVSISDVTEVNWVTGGFPRARKVRRV